MPDAFGRRDRRAARRTHQRMARRLPPKARQIPFLPNLMAGAASPASIAPTSTSGTSKTKRARPARPTPQLAEVKRRIDRTNQLRNDLAEDLDRALLDWLAPQAARRRCAAALRVARPDHRPAFHSGAQDLPHPRRSRTQRRARRPRASAIATASPFLTEQRADLATASISLWRETLAGTRRFKLYRQLKMYNDPRSTPQSTANHNRSRRR